MVIPELLYKYFRIEIPSNKPLWTEQEGVQSVIGEPLPLYATPQTEPGKRLILYNSMEINQNIRDGKGKILVTNVPLKVKSKVDKMFRNRNRYQNISSKFHSPIRWYHIALIHEMECTQNFDCYLGNGQSLYKKTTIVPAGRGPFSSFELGAFDAIRYDKLDLVNDWSIGNALYILEGFNGYGYSRYRGINSPYLWSGSNHYTSGKYITDNVYSKTAVSTQIGIALLLKEILSRL